MINHYTYVTFKESTGEYYIGIRSSKCSPQDDPYMGSSKILKARLKNESDWSKYIIKTYSTREEAGEAEPELIEGHRNNGLCLNISPGGHQWYEMAKHKKIQGMSEKHKDSLKSSWGTTKEKRREALRLGWIKRKAKFGTSGSPNEASRRQKISATQAKRLSSLTSKQKRQRVQAALDGQ